MNRSTWLPVSAQECALSAIIDAEPVMNATTVLATEIARFAKNATMTVVVLSPPDSPPFVSGPVRVSVIPAPAHFVGGVGDGYPAPAALNPAAPCGEKGDRKHGCRWCTAG